MIRQSERERLTAILKTAGYSEEEAEVMLGKFLEEEAETFIECMESVSEESGRYRRRMS